METTVFFKDNVRRQINADPELFGAVAAALGVVPSSLSRLMNQRHPKLTQANVLFVVKEHLGAQSTDDLLDVQSSEENLTNE